MTIKMTGVVVEDPMKAFEHYTTVLGFEKHTLIPEAQLAIVKSPEDPDGVTLMLEPNGSPISQNYKKSLWDAKIPCIVFGTKDIEKECARLKEKGVSFLREPVTNEYGSQATFDDGCGNYIMLHQDPEKTES